MPVYPMDNFLPPANGFNSLLPPIMPMDPYAPQGPGGGRRFVPANSPQYAGTMAGSMGRGFTVNPNGTIDMGLGYGQLALPQAGNHSRAMELTGTAQGPGGTMPGPGPNPWGPGAGGSLYGALSQDIANQQGAANRQFGRNNAEIAGMRGFIDQAPNQFLQQGAASAEDLLGMAGRAESMGTNAYNQWAQRADQTTQAVNQGVAGALSRVDKGLGYGDQAISTYQKAVQEYEDRGAQDASVTAAGIRRSSLAAIQQASAGINPDGTLMTTAQRADSIARVRADTAEQVQSAVTPILTQFNNVRVQLKQGLAQLQQSVGGMHLQGAELAEQGTALKGQVGTTLAGQSLDASQVRNQMLQLSSTLHQAAASIKDASLLNAVNLEMSGRTSIADMVRQNPETVVSLFNGLMALTSLSNAQATNQSAGQASVGGGPRARGNRGGGGGSQRPAFGGDNQYQPVQTQAQPHIPSQYDYIYPQPQQPGMPNQSDYMYPQQPSNMDFPADQWSDPSLTGGGFR